MPYTQWATNKDESVTEHKRSAFQKQTHFNQELSSLASPILARSLLIHQPLSMRETKEANQEPSVATFASCSGLKLGFWEPRLLMIHVVLAKPLVLHIPFSHLSDKSAQEKHFPLLVFINPRAPRCISHLIMN